MLEAIYVGDNLVMLVADYAHWKRHQHNDPAIILANLGERL